jgi:hypothetical protein
VTPAGLRAALAAFDRDGSFSEDDYEALKAAVVGVGRVPTGVLDGLLGLFFERHVLDDVRRAELLALSPEDLLKAVRFRFKQVVAGTHEARQPWHALAPHVRDALETIQGPGGHFPARIASAAGFSALAVEQAVAALWAEQGRRPTHREATVELFKRYVSTDRPTFTTSREYPAVVISRLDAQRLARGVLEILSDDEKDLFRAQIDGESVETWASRNAMSRASAYRLLARIKALCRTEFEERTRHTRLDVLDAIRAQLPSQR